ncbi:MULTISPECIES: PLD nuclease N-terminal domain-containing protein [Microbacterium]|uniref:Phospholipase_D-nuclease N-terminal n=1 Tax=Microbacterium saccharophilum TaxID=1213358 RepID=A0A7Z7CYW5_9MICO|nr:MULTISPECIES: PLD nuclease N-terminal domain-containing protein [Microbacterium]SFI17384.1 Phospholipase_D-nuclease N-terminal [Microbacterium saccharophilum]
MARVLLPLALLLIAFWVFSIVDCALQPPTRHRGVSKPVWLLIVILLPVVGGILWLAVGRTKRRTPPVFRAPDDNPDFLGRIGTISDQDERIRRLEEELAALDAEAEDPPRTAPPSDAPTETPSETSGDGDSDEPTGPRGSRS